MNEPALFDASDFEDEPQRAERRRKSTKVFADYDAFVGKFKPKKTSDDCYTPPEVYEAVKGWVNDNLLPLDGVEIVRPFWPGADYQAYDYPPGCLVLDNPPFSILARIRAFYMEHGIRYFLFAPALTLCPPINAERSTFVICGCNVTYANGAEVSTSFVTNIDCDARLIVSGTLADRIKEAQAGNGTRQRPPVYEYPANVTSAALLQRISARGGGVDVRIGKDECRHIGELDSQRCKGKSIFGYGWLLSDAAARRVEEAKARAAGILTDRAEVQTWELSARERAVIERLNRKAHIG